MSGNGDTVLQATFSQYSGKYNATQFSRNTNVGNSDRYTLAYAGPAGEGRSFAPGFDLNNYSGVVAGTFPALNVQFADDLSSPVTTEYTFGVARMFGARSYAKAVFVQRKTSNFIEEFIQFANGKTPIVINGATLGQLDNIVYDNSDEMKREYQALQFMGQHRLMNALSVNGHWTVQLKNDGNFEGETPNPTGSVYGDYPEMLSLARSAPDGRLDDFQRSKVRVWADYRAALGRFGSFTVAPIYRYNSARTYSLVLNGQPLSTMQAGAQSGLRRHADAAGLLRRARLAVVRGVRDARPRGDLRGSGVEVGAAVDQVRDVQRAEQPEAHRVGHDDYRRPGEPARRVRAADGLPGGPALRPGHVERALPDAARRHRRRQDVRLRGRLPLLRSRFHCNDAERNGILQKDSLQSCVLR